MPRGPCKQAHQARAQTWLWRHRRRDSPALRPGARLFFGGQPLRLFLCGARGVLACRGLFLRDPPLFGLLRRAFSFLTVALSTFGGDPLGLQPLALGQGRRPRYGLDLGLRRQLGLDPGCLGVFAGALLGHACGPRGAFASVLFLTRSPLLGKTLSGNTVFFRLLRRAQGGQALSLGAFCGDLCAKCCLFARTLFAQFFLFAFAQLTLVPLFLCQLCRFLFLPGALLTFALPAQLFLFPLKAFTFQARGQRLCVTRGFFLTRALFALLVLFALALLALQAFRRRLVLRDALGLGALRGEACGFSLFHRAPFCFQALAFRAFQRQPLCFALGSRNPFRF